MRVVGLFGGMFDPPHLGHVAVARAARGALGLDVLVVTVARSPGHRADPVAAPEVRLEMAHAAFDDLDGVVVSDRELRRAGPTYTIDTVEELLEEGPDDHVVLLVGADAAEGLPGWHRAGELARLVEVAVVPRPGTSSGLPPGFRARIVAMDPIDLSSTQVRAALAAGGDPTGLIPARVVPLVTARRLYSP